MKSALIAVCCAFGTSAMAQSPEVRIHGFATWSYGRTTNDNRYLGGDRAGNYAHTDVALNLTSVVSERFHIVVQPHWETNHGTSEPEVGLDYAFAQVDLGSRTQLRVGQVKQPFGIYTEVIDVGTLRPGLFLPQGMYGPLGLVGASYYGIGVTANLPSVARWEIGIDAYAGGMSLVENVLPDRLLAGDTAVVFEAREDARDVVGARLEARSFANGLTLGASGYRGLTQDGERKYVGGAHLELNRGRATLRTELIAEREGAKRGWGGYVEGAVNLNDPWQIHASWNSSRSRFDTLDVAPYPSLLEHREWVAGVNYWLSSSLVFKTSVHRVTGNRLAQPDRQSLFPVQDIERRTIAVLAGAQFTF